MSEPVGSASRLSELVARQANELALQEQARNERRTRLDALAVIDLRTACSLLTADNADDMATVQQWDQERRGQWIVPEIPPFSAMPELPDDYLDALVNRIYEVREALRTVYGEKTPRPRPGRLPKPTPGSDTQWDEALRWLYDTNPDDIRNEAQELAGTAPGRDVLRALVGVTLYRVPFRLAYILSCNISFNFPPALPTPPTPEQWNEKTRTDAAFMESLRRTATPANRAEEATTEAAEPAPDELPNETPPAHGNRRSEGGKPADRSKGIPRAEAEILVRDWLLKHAKEKPASITRDAVAAGTGVSTGMVSKTAKWKAFRERRDAETKPGTRELPLSATMQAAIPADCANPAELAELIDEQAKEKAEDERRHKRRHEPS